MQLEPGVLHSLHSTTYGANGNESVGNINSSLVQEKAGPNSERHEFHEKINGLRETPIVTDTPERKVVHMTLRMVEDEKIPSSTAVFRMTPTMPVRGTIDQIITNENNLYEGNLVSYFRIIFHEATNVTHPYHNFRHMMHVTWLCHEACIFYIDTLSKRQMRNVLIAAMFHDFDHPGTLGDDNQNIMRSIEGLKKHILPEDSPSLDDIKTIIQATEYPYKTDSSTLSLSAQIIRDADTSQSLNPSWLQQIIFGLAAEWNKPPLDVLKAQGAYHRNLKLVTTWGKQMWPQEKINEKIDEAEKLLKILEL